MLPTRLNVATVSVAVPAAPVPPPLPGPLLTAALAMLSRRLPSRSTVAGRGRVPRRPRGRREHGNGFLTCGQPPLAASGWLPCGRGTEVVMRWLPGQPRFQDDDSGVQIEEADNLSEDCGTVKVTG